MERLQKIIAESGYCSRRKAEQLIIEGDVSVNGQIIRELGFKADRNADIRINGKPLSREEKVVYLLNKPRNVISSASDDRGRRTVVDLIESPYRLFPLGRLDYDSSGLILVSNDGELMQKLIHPRFEVEKVYEVRIDGIIDAGQIQRLEEGVVIDGRKTARAKITLLSVNENKKQSFLQVAIHEGRNRQIRKMFATQGFEVVRLHRIREAGLELGDLKSGEYRRLKPHELKRLESYLDGNDR